MKLKESVWESNGGNPLHIIAIDDDVQTIDHKKDNAKHTIRTLKNELERKQQEIEQLKTQLKVANNIIKDIDQTKQNLFENIYAIENLEREKLAYCLHEGIGQDLASLRYMLKDTIEQLAAKNISTYNLPEIHAMMAKTIVEVKNVTYKIIPADITKFGFIHSLQSMVEDLNHHFSSTKFTFYTNFTDELPSINDQLSIYRIIQECINNIIKHSHASEAGIQITSNHNSLLITVEDNGVGFDYSKKLKKASSRGLKNVLSRTKDLNADLLVDSSPRFGTCIHILLNNRAI